MQQHPPDSKVGSPQKRPPLILDQSSSSTNETLILNKTINSLTSQHEIKVSQVSSIEARLFETKAELQQLIGPSSNLNEETSRKLYGYHTENRRLLSLLVAQKNEKLQKNAQALIIEQIREQDEEFLYERMKIHMDKLDEMRRILQDKEYGYQVLLEKIQVYEELEELVLKTTENNMHNLAIQSGNFRVVSKLSSDKKALEIQNKVQQQTIKLASNIFNDLQASVREEKKSRQQKQLKKLLNSNKPINPQGRRWHSDQSDPQDKSPFQRPTVPQVPELPLQQITCSFGEIPKLPLNNNNRNYTSDPQLSINKGQFSSRKNLLQVDRFELLKQLKQEKMMFEANSRNLADSKQINSILLNQNNSLLQSCKRAQARFRRTSSKLKELQNKLAYYWADRSLATHSRVDGDQMSFEELKRMMWAQYQNGENLHNLSRQDALLEQKQQEQNVPIGTQGRVQTQQIILVTQSVQQQRENNKSSWIQGRTSTLLLRNASEPYIQSFITE